MNYNTYIEYREYCKGKYTYCGVPNISIIDFNKIFSRYLSITQFSCIGGIKTKTIDNKITSFIFDKIPNRLIIFNPQSESYDSDYYNMALNKYFDKNTMPKHFSIFFDYDDIIKNENIVISSMIKNIYNHIIKYKIFHKRAVSPKINIYILTKDESRNWCKHNGIKFKNKAISKIYDILQYNGFDEKYFHVESCRYFMTTDKNSGYEIRIHKDKHNGSLCSTISRDLTHIRKEDVI